MPACVGSQIKGPCSRIDLLKKHAGIDVQAMYPAGSAAEGGCLDARRHAQGRRGLPQGRQSRSASGSARPRTTSTPPARSSSRSAPTLVDAKGNITVKSDAVRQALEYYKKLAQWLPPDAPAWDNASNNKYLISGKGSLIMNPPSAWAVAKRDAPQVAEQCWTHGMPSGPKGRYAPFLPYFWGIWNFGKNKPAAKSLLRASLAAARRSRRWSWPAPATTCRRSRS